jgi:hypothetical protein
MLGSSLGGRGRGFAICSQEGACNSGLPLPTTLNINPAVKNTQLIYMFDDIIRGL